MSQLNEIKLSRVWQYWSNPERVAALLTAFRGNFDLEENLRRNRALAADVRNLGYGFVFVDGYWIENQGTDLERKVKEDTLLITAPADKFEKFERQMIQLARQYNQEAVLIKSADGSSRVQYVDGDSIDLGSIRPDGMGEIYTQLKRTAKGQPIGRTFTFEDVREDIGWLQRLAGLAKK
jgi:hypothetical protein